MKFTVFLFFIIFVPMQLISQSNIKSISYNIRWNNPDDGEDNWEHRKEALGSFLSEEKADFIGLQEALYGQLKFLDDFLEDHKYLGVGRDDGLLEGEFSPLLYDSSRWNVIEYKYFWLSETPDSVSMGWDAVCNRVVTYGLFENKMDKNQVAVFNTHFDHRGEIARTKSIGLINNWVNELANGKPTILMGDFNLIPTDPNYNLLTENLNDSRVKAHNISEDHNGTFNGFELKGEFERRIDYIFVSNNFRVDHYATYDLRINGRHMSDHFPVIVNLSIK